VKLLIVIVNWRTSDLVIDCLRSLEVEVARLPGTEVVVADNGSGDGSVEKMQAAIGAGGWDGWVRVMPLEKNGGFAWGNNAAIRPALASSDPPQYVYMLNPDTTVFPGAAEELVRFLEQRPKAGVVGGRAENPDGTIRRTAFRFQSPLSELEGSVRLGLLSRLLQSFVVAPPVPDEPAQFDWVSGGSMIIRREVLDTVGLLDDRYFMYFEETDFCRRVRNAGWEVWYLPQSRIIHLVGQASGATGEKRLTKRRPEYWFASRRIYFLTHYGRLKTAFADLLWAGGFAVGNLLRIVRRRPRQDPPWLWWDFVRYNVKAWSRLR
jgi:hypothetical protein